MSDETIHLNAHKVWTAVGDAGPFEPNAMYEMAI